MNNFMKKKNREDYIKEYKRVTICFAIAFDIIFLLMAILELASLSVI